MKRAIKTVLDRLADDAAATLSRGAPGGVLAAVSGGVDSTALALVLSRLAVTQRLAGPLTVAHVDHGLRADSRLAAAGVGALASELGVQHRTRRLALGPGPHGEAALRRARYDALLAMAREVGATQVLTAHHADDQLETVLFRVLRGGGPVSFAGIPRCRALAPGVSVLRPLLSVPRRELLQLIAESGQPVFEDPSNRDLRHTRNRIRHDVLPRLRRRHGERLDATLHKLAAAARQLGSVLDRGARTLLAQRARAVTDWRIELDTTGLEVTQRPFVEEALRRLLLGVDGRRRQPAWTTVQRAVELIDRPAGTRVHGPGQPLVERLRDGLLLVDLERAGEPAARPLVLEPGGPPRRFGSTEWRLDACGHSRGPAATAGTPDRWRVWVDPADAPLPWSLRPRRPGDRFWPLGMPGPVDLRGFLCSRHVPRFDRDRLPLVVDARDQVVWIPGVEIGHRARRHAGTDGCVELWVHQQMTGGATAAAEPY